MKNLSNKILIFYHFQLESGSDLNVASLPRTDRQITVKDAIQALPVDLTHGLYHFRFKSQVTEGSDKMLAWMDINNIGTKAPQINGAIHMKILRLKEPNHNKLFHLDKLKKSEIIKLGPHHSSNHHHQVHSAPKNTAPSPTHPPNNTIKEKVPQPTQNTQLLPPNRHSPSPPNQTTPLPSKTPIEDRRQQPVKISPSSTPTSATPAAGSLLSFDIVKQDVKPKVIPATSDQKLDVMRQQFKEQEENRENERIAHLQLEDTLKKWGYTDMKKINNTTTLLATLHTIWPEWEPVSLSDMLTQEKVNSLFKKAVIKVHPDKNRHRHFKEKYLSKRIFELLNESRKQ